MATADRWAGLVPLERVVADPVRFKLRLRIGDDVYALSRMAKLASACWDTAGMAATGANVAKSALVAGTVFAAPAPTGLLASLGLATPAVAVTPVGWVIAAAIVAGGGYYGVTRLLAGWSAGGADVVPRFLNTPIDQLGAALFDFVAGLGVLVAQADGEIAAAERALLLDHLVDDWGFDRAYAEAALPLVETDADGAAVEASARDMARFLADSPDCNSRAIQAELLAFLHEIVGADGRVDPAEQAVIARIERAFADAGRWSVARARADADALLRAARMEAAAAAGDALAVARAGTGKAAATARDTLATTAARTGQAAGSARAALGRLLRQSR